jgi:hypothetical protein
LSSLLALKEGLVAVSTVDDADTIGDNDAAIIENDNLVADGTVVVHHYSGSVRVQKIRRFCCALVRVLT